ALFIDIVDDLIEFSLIGLLLKAAFDIIKSQKEKWLLTFIIPFVVIFTIDETYKHTIDDDYSLLYLDSYGVILISTFLFYFVSFRLITTPKNILVTATNKYITSNLSKPEVDSTIQALHQLMIEKKIFKNQKLSVAEVAKELGITRQQLSEILNSHMKTRFQDLLNQYRVEEFINCLDQEKYNHFTLLGIASEAGFSSKSSFNSTFKKLKGVTPSQYRDGQK
ncbi:MAG: helix-turn-helix transcriptional regulator, partial [Bacteroidota bacterium]